ncbi:hypothetical protein [Leifsonia shinshuensis]|uniref:hypothetical protein n=1 Tax=Leifsonia shinshuensis TaxID=150026 RepID=UPI00285B17FF|nr:hypothetical protein [Leifsonia shinshuensis]MDR6971898.1 glucan phosphoethanolaminetransferase (alkaline phosphatase superfamily) [Leifsonia shinshuensis]
MTTLPPGTTTRRPVIVWDLVTSIVLMVVGVVLAGILTFAAFFLVFASDPCGGSTVCDTERMGIGFFVALIGPAAVTVVAIIAAVVLLVLRRISFWVPIVGMLLAVGVWVGGAALVISGVPGATF